MSTRVRVILLIAIILPVLQIWSQQSADTGIVFSTQIQPILTRNCQGCHQGGAAPADLQLDSAAGVLKGSVSGKVFVPGNSSESLIYHRITGKDGVVMPPTGRTLAEPEIALIKKWIDEGAKMDAAALAAGTAKPKHWAYVKPTRPALPAVKDAAWARNGIDRFVLARLEKEGLKPSSEASRETLIRRLSLDLIGLPPTPAEIDAFLNDKRPDAYERVVDRLLASSAYGERWATPWLDYARYADSEGWTNDRQRVAWPYRDWVIRTLNKNMPFDQFTIEQIAGDMLPNPTTDQKIATGFLRNSMQITEGGVDPEEAHWVIQVDRASTIGTVFLGSSLGCAQCHNHKYDPFTQKDFYSMVAFFNNGTFDVPVRDPKRRITAFSLAKTYFEKKLDLATPEQEQKRTAMTAEIANTEKQLNEVTPAFTARQTKWEREIVAFENEWKPLIPSSVTSADGTTLTASPDGSVLASGKNPEADTYVWTGKAPFAKITGIRVEALPDASLPHGGPGRDFYGNFMMRDVRVEVGPSERQLSKVTFKQVLTDIDAPPLENKDGEAGRVKQIWVVDASLQSGRGALKVTGGTEGRVRVQLILIPDKPIQADANGVVRVSLEQFSEYKNVNLGKFRISFTSAPNPEFANEVKASLRPVLSIPAGERSAEQADGVVLHFRTLDGELKPLRDKIASLKKDIDALDIPKALIMSEDMNVARPATFIRQRGAFVSKGEEVQATAPEFLAPMPAGAPYNRLGLAQWLVSRDNPLTARVTVNHFWETMFGRGIVETAEDFGSQGFAPSHPDLLDWLAVEFMEKGWDMKAIKRTIVTSATYRQSSTVTPELLEKDPGNALLARGPRIRVEGEMIRDIAMSASGLLSGKMFGSPVMPYQPEGVWGNFVNQGDADRWVVSPQEDRYRRGLYTFVRRSARYPALAVFDAPTREFCTARRTKSDTPLQALTTLNDPAFFEAAQAMAKRIVKEGGADPSSRVTYGFRLATSRVPRASEKDALLSGYEKSLQYYQSNPQEAEQVAGQPDAQLAAWTMLSNSLLNLDESISKK